MGSGGRGGISFSYRTIATVKYNSAGMQQWVARYIGPRDSVSNSVVGVEVDRSGAVCITGSVYIGTPSRSTITTIMYDPLGAERWVARYDASGNRATAVAMTLGDSSSVYVTGYTSAGSTTSDFVTLKYNSSGNQQWVARYDGQANRSDTPRGIASDDSGNVYVTGTSTTAASPSRQMIATVKYGATGVQRWVASYSSSPSDNCYARAIALDDSGFAIVAGTAILPDPKPPQA